MSGIKTPIKKVTEKVCYKCGKKHPIEKFKYRFGYNDHMYENNKHSTRCESCRGKAAAREKNRRHKKKTPTPEPKMPMIAEWVDESGKFEQNKHHSTGYNMRRPGPPRTTDYGHLLADELSAMANPELPASKREHQFVTSEPITISNAPISSLAREPTAPLSQQAPEAPQVAPSANELDDFDFSGIDGWEEPHGGKKRKSKKRKSRKRKSRKRKSRKRKSRKIKR